MIFLKSSTLHALLLMQGLFLFFYGNYVLKVPQWVALSSIQYSTFIISAICWFGTDISGVKQIKMAKTEFQMNDVIINIFSTRILLLIITSPTLFMLYDLKTSLLIISLSISYLMAPSFYFYGNQEKFHYFFHADIVLRTTNILIITFVIINQGSYFQYFLLINICQITYVLYLFFRIEHLDFVCIMKILKFSDVKFSIDDKSYFLMQVCQQMLYSTPAIFLDNIGKEESAAVFTNVERIIRIIRGFVGNAVKVLLGSDRLDWNMLTILFKRNMYRILFIGSFVFLFINLILAYIVYFELQTKFFVSIMILTLPVVTITSLCVGIKYRSYNFPDLYSVFMLLLIVSVLISFYFFGQSIIYIATIIILAEIIICVRLIGDAAK